MENAELHADLPFNVTGLSPAALQWVRSFAREHRPEAGKLLAWLSRVMDSESGRRNHHPDREPPILRVPEPKQWSNREVGEALDVATKMMCAAAFDRSAQTFTSILVGTFCVFAAARLKTTPSFEASLT